MIARRYGASPLHLLAHGLLFAAAGWVLLQVMDVRRFDNVLAWLLAAVVLHDLVLLPAYSVLDRAGQAVSRRLAAGDPAAVNHLRVPAALAALTFLVFLPLVTGRSDANLARVSGMEPSGYLERWLAVVAALFALSALAWVVRALRRRPPAQHVRAPVGGQLDDGARRAQGDP
jgi:hypothetical protein